MQLRFNRTYVVVLWLGALGALVVGVLLALAPFRPDTRWQWSDTLVAYSLSAPLLFMLLWSVYRNGKTVLTSEAIQQPSLRGTLHLRWSDVQRVGIAANNSFTLVGPAAKVVVVTFAYENHQVVAQFILDHVRKHSSATAA